MVRFEYSEDTMNDCLTLTDNEDRLKTGFDSEIILYPLDDAVRVITELNIQSAVVKMLCEQLEHYEDSQDIDYWIKEVREGIE